jgi:dsDNA-specific endonuclease/ATPase MutS2
MDDEEIIHIPIEDSIDLHTFRPTEIKDLLHDYIETAHEKGFQEVRIIHGKGSGVQRRIVQSILEKHPLVASFRTADETAGGWGATIARLKGKVKG